MELKPCDLIIVRGKALISEIIEDVTNSKYSHVCGYIGNDELVEAEGFEKTGKVPLSKYNKHDYDVYRYEGLTNEQKEGILNYISSQIGGQYNYFMLVIELIRYVFHIILPYKEPYKSHICSMLWADAFKNVGIDLCPWTKIVSPSDISESKLLKKIN